MPGKINITIELKGELLEIIQGHLLGDGYIPATNRRNHYFGLASKHQEYVKYVIKTLKPLKPGKIHERLIDSKTYYSFQTKSLISPEFHNYWYINGKKIIIPKNIKLTPTIILHWYLDDGCLTNRQGDIILATCSFTVKEQEEILIPQLKNMLYCGDGSIKVNISSQGYPYIIIPRRYTKRFLEYIGECPVKCYAYKWKIKPYTDYARKRGRDYL